MKMCPFMKSKVFVDHSTACLEGRNRELLRTYFERRMTMEEQDLQLSVTEWGMELMSENIASCRNREAKLQKYGKRNGVDHTDSAETWGLETLSKDVSRREDPRQHVRNSSSRDSMIVLTYLTIRRTGNGGHESGSVRQTRRRFTEASQHDLLEEMGCQTRVRDVERRSLTGSNSGYATKKN